MRLALMLAPLLASAAPLSREGAREAARRELSKPPYHRDDPSLTERALRAAGRWVGDVFQRAAAASPGRGMGAVLLLVLVVLLVVAVGLRVGPLAGGAAARSPLLSNRARTPQEYRAGAAAAVTSGDYAAGLRDQLRAVAREVEIRGVLDPRAGRTADELLRDISAVLPDVESGLRAAVTAFNEVWYGGRPAVRYDFEQAVDADRAVLDALRRATVGAPASPAGRVGRG